MASGYNRDEIEAIADLERFMGWKLVRECIERQMRLDTDSLARADLDASPCAAARLQGQLRRAKDILSLVDNARQKHLEGE